MMSPLIGKLALVWILPPWVPSGDPMLVRNTCLCESVAEQFHMCTRIARIARLESVYGQAWLELQ